ncbi:MAG: hypothetical protein Q4D78_09995 [Neisseria zoodegmatis]|uniref:hypothetical protein n=1 Tax=Neisseria zoodegmatis TaxID=326523 RepID=UPI0026F259D8|nr:hypothetical protein [Neisseria zoodegmatis]MDO5070500.1 hypothetical protein [Neisseria zoodegmatis]
MKKRFLFKNEGFDEQAIISAIKHAINLSGQNCKIHIVYPQKSNFEFSDIGGIIDKIFGAGSAKKLCKGESIECMDFILPSKINSYNSSGVVLALYCTSDDMNLIDSNTSADSIIFVSWLLKEANIWESTWYNNGLVVMNGEASQQIESLPKEVIQKLELLTRIINLSTGLTHPSDQKHAERIFKELKEDGYKADEQLITSWAIANGWNARHLNDLKKLTKKYLS